MIKLPSNPNVHPLTLNNERHRERRQNTPVIVTALLDIGRGDWFHFTRPFDIYLSWLLDLLQMENRVIIYCDQSVVDFLANQVDLDRSRIQIVPITLEHLPFYGYREEIQQVIDREQKEWHPKWDRKMRDHPEAKYADYNILVNSKPYWLYNATRISRFPAEYFVWVDAGYSHGLPGVIPRNLWEPELTPNKITAIKLTSSLDKVHKYTLDLVYRKHLSVISGGFLAGDAGTIKRFYVFYYNTFTELVDDGKVDDDQTTLLMTIRSYASTFNLLYGGWLDGFKLLPSRQSATNDILR